MSQMVTDTKQSNQKPIINPHPREEHDSDGHAFPLAEFVEIDQKCKDDVLNRVPEISAVALLRLTRRNGSWLKYSGLVWRVLLAEKTRWDKMRWVRMTAILSLASNARMNEDCTFRLWFCLRASSTLNLTMKDHGQFRMSQLCPTGCSLAEWKDDKRRFES
jgi:hypothetical protein